MNKKTIYQMPTTEVVRIKMEALLLPESPVVPAAAPEVNARRNSYGFEEAVMW